MTAIAATFVSCSTVSGRKTARLVFELPIEKLSEALSTLGSPDPHGDSWCGIARIKPEAAKQPNPGAAQQPNPDASERAKRHYQSLTPEKQVVARAGMLCADQEYWRFIGVSGEREARASMLRELGIASRRELASDEIARERFERQEADFKQWSGRMAEIRNV